ncbi:MAG: Rrf2 family transcriptional regulator [Anaerovibrio sp.]|nr:Rrf2 family transcriptional regulator [Anaerovibrio sp.]
MRISAKGRYGLAAMVHLALNYNSGSPITIISISEKMGISKIYLEQVFALLKRGGLVLSMKGSQGGYQLARSPQEISAYDILASIETSMMEPADKTVADTQPHLENAMQELVFSKLDISVKTALTEVSLEDLLQNIESQSSPEQLMYFI